MAKYKKLKNQPLKLVIAEFKYTPVLQIEEYIPKFQDNIRKAYPMMQESAEQVFQVQPNSIKTDLIKRWSFISADKLNAVDITRERMIYYTSDYPRFEGFSSKCENILDILNNVIEPELSTRIGLRYCDLVVPEDKEKITDLIDSQLTFPDTIKKLGVPAYQRNESLVNTKEGTLAIRSLYGKHNLSFLQDIKVLPVQVNQDPVESERMIVDFDHFWEAGDGIVKFDVSKVIEKLNNLHTISREAFWTITTEYAKDKKWS